MQRNASRKWLGVNESPKQSSERGLMGGRVFVIGGGGFLGSEFCKIAAINHDVVVCDSPERLRSISTSLNQVEYDFGNQNPDCIPCSRGDKAVVFSWRGYPAVHEENPVETLERNLRSTLQLIRFLVAKGVEDIFYASSGGAVYGSMAGRAALESDPVNPVGFYGIGKATAEMYVRKIVSESASRYMIFRIGNAYGKGQLERNLSVGFLAHAIRSAQSGRELSLWGDGSIARDYIHSEDIASGMEVCLNLNKVPSGTYNLGTGKATDQLQIVRIVEKILGKKINLMTYPSRDFDVQSISLNSNLLFEKTGWKACLDIESGILDFFNIGEL